MAGFLEMPPLFSASALRRLPTTGTVPPADKVKREYQLAERGPFVGVRDRAANEVVTFQQLRDRSDVLRDQAGLRACYNNEMAIKELRAAVQSAIGSASWRELWILIAQLQHWLEIMDISGANDCWPFWLILSDEARAGDSAGTALQVQGAEAIVIGGEGVAPSLVKSETGETGVAQPRLEAKLHLLRVRGLQPVDARPANVSGARQCCHWLTFRSGLPFSLLECETGAMAGATVRLLRTGKASSAWQCAVSPHSSSRSNWSGAPATSTAAGFA